MAVIEYVGTLSRAGLSQGHYTCDVRDKSSSIWYRTNDENYPIELDSSEVTRNAYVILYKRVDE